MSVTVSAVIERLGLQAAGGADNTETEVTGAQVCDLLSHVMAQGRAGQVWITIQTHANIIAVAALAKLAAVIVAGGFAPEEETIMRAEEEGIALLLSREKAYTLAGQLYEMGVR
ncbi:serine kinase [bacterium]|nr:serine kinase [bacterium]